MKWPSLKITIPFEKAKDLQAARAHNAEVEELNKKILELQKVNETILNNLQENLNELRRILGICLIPLYEIEKKFSCTNQCSKKPREQWCPFCIAVEGLKRIRDSREFVTYQEWLKFPISH